jgi:hypothetical protein
MPKPRPGMRLPNSSEPQRHFTSEWCGRPDDHSVSGIGASRKDVIIGSSKSTRFTTVT